MLSRNVTKQKTADRRRFFIRNNSRNSRPARFHSSFICVDLRSSAVSNERLLLSLQFRSRNKAGMNYILIQVRVRRIVSDFVFGGF